MPALPRLDIPDRRRYLSRMSPVLRRLLVLILVFALLPWGAWIKAAQSRPPPQQSVIALVQPTVPTQLAARAPHCRTATLPGQSCPVDPALMPDSVPAMDAATARALRTATVHGRDLFTASGPERPPRFG